MNLFAIILLSWALASIVTGLIFGKVFGTVKEPGLENLMLAEKRDDFSFDGKESVSYQQIECRTCKESSTPFEYKTYPNRKAAEQETDPGIPEGSSWDWRHARDTGHKSFNYYTTTKNYGKVFFA